MKWNFNFQKLIARKNKLETKCVRNNTGLAIQIESILNHP